MKYGILFLLILVMLCYFETLLATKENKYYGLILPMLTFITATVWTISLVDKFDIVKILCTLIFTNIPTYILLLFYRLGQKRYKKENSGK